jgi:PAS domain-containing protein
MKESEFDIAADTIETNPIAHLKRCVHNCINTRLRMVKLSESQIERFAAAPLKKLFDDAKSSIERGSFNVDEHILAFDQALLERVRYERERGELKPITAESELKDHQQLLRDRLYGAPELDAIRYLLKPGERIVKVDWHSVETTAQVILRRDLPRACRPVSFRNGPEWRKQFVSDAQIQEAIQAEVDRNRPIRGQTISPWID